jgi:hypothetical protein
MFLLRPTIGNLSGSRKKKCREVKEKQLMVNACHHTINGTLRGWQAPGGFAITEKAGENARASYKDAAFGLTSKVDAGAG